MELGSLAVIVVDDATQYIPAFHRSFVARTPDRYWTALLDPLVCTPAVVIIST
jgi:hypothetical protein